MPSQSDFAAVRVAEANCFAPRSGCRPAPPPAPDLPGRWRHDVTSPNPPTPLARMLATRLCRQAGERLAARALQRLGRRYRIVELLRGGSRAVNDISQRLSLKQLDAAAAGVEVGTREQASMSLGRRATRVSREFAPRRASTRNNVVRGAAPKGLCSVTTLNGLPSRGVDQVSVTTTPFQNATRPAISFAASDGRG